MTTSPQPRRALLALLVATLTLLAACGGTSSSDRADTAPADRSDDASSVGGGGAVDGEATTTGPGGEAGVPAPDADSGVATEEGAGSDGAAGEQGPTDPTLAAGRVDDGEAWEDYLVYREEAGRGGIPLAPIDVDSRRVLTVVDADDAPVRGATVEVLDGADEVVATVRTHADGRAVVFAAPEAATRSDQQRGTTTRYRVTSPAGDVEAEVGPDDLAPVLRAPGARPSAAPDVDLQLVIDATGSMSDEIERLKANLSTVIEGIGDLPGSPRVRLGMTVYRDQGDEFVTRTVPFTTDAAAFVDELRTVTADGGGDTPEAVEPALANALEDLDWSEDPGTVKLAFLVADAPPHLAGADVTCGGGPGGPVPSSTEDDETTATEVAPDEPCSTGPVVDDDGPYYLDSATRFAARGIKLVPIASSNLDPVGESVFRELALVTQAPFLFLTYGADGASPGDERPDLHVDDFSVLSLDEMVARVVAEELEATA